MRRVINKKITEDDIIETSRLIFSEGMENLRLYFLWSDFPQRMMMTLKAL